MAERDEVIDHLTQEVRTLREELTLLHSEIVRMKERMARMEREIPTPRQLGRVLEALRILEKTEMDMEGRF
jgi:phage shock protein A